jgi:hypothetical protein
VRGKSTARVALLTALLSLAPSGCGGPGHPQPPGPPPSTRATTPTHAPPPSPHVTVTAQAQARAAYLAMWNAYVTASSTADYQSPALARYAAGAALPVLTNGLYASYKDGIVTKGTPSFSPSVTILVAAGGVQQADVTDCADTSTWANYTRSGQLVPGQPQGRRRVTARLQLFIQAGGSQWKVTSLNVGRAGTC